MVKKALNSSNILQSRSRITRSQTQIITNSEYVSRNLSKKIKTQHSLDDIEDSLSCVESELGFDDFDKTSLQASKGGDIDSDDYNFSDNESTASFRFCDKPITKSQKSIRQAKNSKPKSSRLIRTFSNFTEDEISSESKKAYDYNIMRFSNLKRKKTFRIYCFNECDLNITQEFKENIVQNDSDDDKESDNEQVQRAISHVHNSLLEAVEEENSN